MRFRLPPLRPDDLLAAPVVLGAVLWDVIKHVADPDNSPGQWPARLALILICGLGMFAMIALVFSLLRRWMTGSRIVIALIAVIASASLVKGVAFAWGMVAIGVDDVLQWSYRIPSSVAHTTVVVVLLWAAMSAIRQHYERLAALEAERRELEILRAETRKQLASLDEAATESVRASILSGLGTSPTSDAPSVLRRLHRTIDEVVRPLSRQLESQSDQWLPPRSDREPVRISWRKVLREGPDPALITPVGIGLALLWISLPLNITRGGMLFELQFLLMLSVVFVPVMWLGLRAAIWLTARLAMWWHPPIFLLALVAGGLALGVALRPFAGGFPTPWMYVFLGPIFTVLVGVLWAFAVSAQRQARATQSRAEQSSADLRWSITRARELHRQHRRALADAVHGQVQASLAAAILQLGNALRDGTADEATVVAIQDRVVASVASLDMLGVHPNSVDEVLAKTRATWIGVADIELTMAPSIGSALRGDPQTLMTVNDIVPELVFNSIKHGRASHIDIEIRDDSDRSIALVVVDDGEPPSTHAVSGMGSRLLDTCALSWTRYSRNGVSVTEVILTCDPASTAFGR